MATYFKRFEDGPVSAATNQSWSTSCTRSFMSVKNDKLFGIVETTSALKVYKPSGSGLTQDINLTIDYPGDLPQLPMSIDYYDGKLYCAYTDSDTLGELYTYLTVINDSIEEVKIKLSTHDPATYKSYAQRINVTSDGVFIVQYLWTSGSASYRTVMSRCDHDGTNYSEIVLGNATSYNPINNELYNDGTYLYLTFGTYSGGHKIAYFRFSLSNINSYSFALVDLGSERYYSASCINGSEIWWVYNLVANETEIRLRKMSTTGSLISDVAIDTTTDVARIAGCGVSYDDILYYAYSAYEATAVMKAIVAKYDGSTVTETYIKNDTVFNYDSTVINMAVDGQKLIVNWHYSTSPRYWQEGEPTILEKYIRVR